VYVKNTTDHDQVAFLVVVGADPRSSLISVFQASFQQVVEAYESRARAQYQDQNMNMASEISRVTAELETMCNSLQKQPVYRPVS
jgi:hypothetical protein